MDWSEIAKVALPICKIGGVVGAFLGLSESIRSEKTHNGWRRFGPAFLLLLAVSAEVIDADIKRREDGRAKLEEERKAEIDEQLLRPIHQVSVFYEFSIEKSQIVANDPSYYRRVAAHFDTPEAKAGNFFEFTRTSPLYPSDQGHAVTEALNAFYSATLELFDKASDSGTKPASTPNMPLLYINLSPSTTYRFSWDHMEATSRMNFPPQSRRYMLHKDGVAFMDQPVVANPEDITLDHHLKSASQLVGKELKISVCPNAKSPRWQDDEHAKQLSSMISLAGLWIEFEGVGGIGGAKLTRNLHKDITSDSCARFTYDFPERADQLNQMIE